jgi:predicted dehydrogenase
VPASYVTTHDWKAFAARGPFDAIFITNETAKHDDAIRRALAVGTRALFIEKPLTTDAKRASAIIRLIRKHRVSAFMGYCLQFHEPLVRAKKILDAGTLGTVHALRAFVGQDLRTWRARDYRKSYSASAARGGGALLDLIHEINYPAWLLGTSFTPCAAFMGRVGTLAGDAETLTEIIGTTARGVVVQIHQDVLRATARRTLEIAGSKGSLWWDSDAGTITVATPRGKKEIRIPAVREQMYIREHAAFFRQLKRGKRFSNLDEALRDLRVTDRVRTLAR